MNLTKKLLTVTISVLLVSSMLVGCGSQSGQSSSGQTSSDKTSSDKTVSRQSAEIKIKDYGTIKVELYNDIAPKAVENFTTHAKNGYYDGLTFHRIMDDFMIQGGDPEGTGTGGKSIWEKPFEDEFSDKARNFTGALSMANSGPNTNGSQFFIVNRHTPMEQGEMDFYKEKAEANGAKYSQADMDKYNEVGGTPWLDNVHTVFGQVTEGMDIVTEIMTVKVDEVSAMPETPVVIETIKIIDTK